MATIEPYFLKSGAKRYRVRYRTPDRRSTDKRGFKTMRDAKAFAATVEASKLDGTFIPHAAANVTVGTISKIWREGLAHLEAATQKSNESAWRVHVEPHWKNWPVGEITTPDIRHWAGELATTHSEATARRALHVLRAVLDVAVESRNLRTNPATGIRIKRGMTPQRGYLTLAQVHQLADEVGDHYSTLVKFLVFTGVRFGEASALNVGDVDLDRRRVRVVKAFKESSGTIGPTKTYAQRHLPFPRFLADELRALVDGRNAGEVLFTTPGGSRVLLNNFRERVFMPAVDALTHRGPTGDDGAPHVPFPRITPHDLRHTSASLAISAGANVKAVQTMLGHQSAAMTLDTYSDLFPDDLDQVADAFDAMAT